MKKCCIFSDEIVTNTVRQSRICYHKMNVGRFSGIKYTLFLYDFLLDSYCLHQTATFLLLAVTVLDTIRSLLLLVSMFDLDTGHVSDPLMVFRLSLFLRHIKFAANFLIKKSYTLSIASFFTYPLSLQMELQTLFLHIEIVPRFCRHLFSGNRP